MFFIAEDLYELFQQVLRGMQRNNQKYLEKVRELSPIKCVHA